jgi:hypothetical protein
LKLIILSMLGFHGYLVLTGFVTQASNHQEPKEKVGTPSGAAASFQLYVGQDPTEREGILSQIRGLLWDHLTEHKVAQVQVLMSSLEGDPTTHDLSVETSDKRRWIVKDTVTSEQRLLGPKEKPKHRRAIEKYCSFRRLEVKTDSVIPSDETRLPSDYKLELGSCNKKSVLSF